MASRAEAAISALDVDMKAWLEDDLMRLDEALSGAQKAGFDAESTHALHRVAHNLVGMAGTYGYKEIGRIAARICQQIAAGLTRSGITAIETHVAACRAACK
jgi:chemotaxis protein histidine kinase CheA